MDNEEKSKFFKIHRLVKEMSNEEKIACASAIPTDILCEALGIRLLSLERRVNRLESALLIVGASGKDENQ